LKNKIIIGSRGSDLALWQAHFAQNLLQEAGIDSEIQIIKTQGDVIQHLSFDKMEGKGFFTKELENALLAQEIDLAVHSCKDLETTQPNGLCIGAMPAREDPADMVLIKPQSYDAKMPLFVKENGILGTSSMRRKAQVAHIRPDMQLKDLRGNVPTRIQKLRDGVYDAIILAYAGIKRLQLNLEDLVAIVLPPSEFVPAPAQGVLAFQCREEDVALRQILSALNHAPSSECALAEREVLRQLDGGCQLPFGAYCCKKENNFFMDIAYSSEFGAPLQQFSVSDSDIHVLVEKACNRLG
jgi:hydroxymethylbilane synthase